jgi:hypothetical protein
VKWERPFLRVFAKQVLEALLILLQEYVFVEN